MGLDLEYFKNQTHINDLQKLNDKELYFIIRLLEDELKEFNINDGFKTKGLIIACNEMADLLKDLRFILYGYMDVMRENDLSFCDKTDTERLISNIDKIDNYLTKIKAVRVSKEKVNDLVDTCLLNMRMFYDSMNDYIKEEYNLWEAVRSRQEKINIRKCYMSQGKFNIDKQE